MRLEVAGITSGYQADVPILNGVDLALESGEIVALVGPNGSGKSTLLKALMGYTRCWTGQILAGGRPLQAAPTHMRVRRGGFGYVPQVNSVFGSLTVADNLTIGGLRVARAARKVRMAALFDWYPLLRAKQNTRTDLLSGGERQLVALARALMMTPRFLLLDEPSAGLSPKMLDDVFSMIDQTRQREQCGVLLVEQNVARALAIADRACVLVLGRIALSGPAPEVLVNPRLTELYLGSHPRVGRGPEAIS